jgi:hypothetical protein
MWDPIRSTYILVVDRLGILGSFVWADPPPCGVVVGTMVQSSDARMPLARWPQDAPHPDEEYILSLLIERGDYRWALHQSADEAFFPIIFWRCVDHCITLECVI